MPFDPVTVIEAALDSVMVRVSDCPDEMLLELAVMETVGPAPAETVMVVFAEAVAPDEPVAVAVYEVVEEGVTVIVPPVAAMLYVEPSVPVTLNEAAFKALTVNVSEEPGVMEL